MAIPTVSADLVPALRRLGNRPEHYAWAVDELPPEITKDLLRQLDALGLVEVRFTNCWNIDEKPTPFVTAWFSPLHDREKWQARVRDMTAAPEPQYVAATRVAACAGWHEVLADRKRSDWDRPAEVRLSELGRAARASLPKRAPRKRATSPQVGEQWVRADEATDASGLSADAIRKRAVREKWRTKKSGKMNCYRLADLSKAWPHKKFISDKDGK